ncbi:MAG: hypothetical protein JRG90_06805, partial [Deltaproteobacteria bacterium]|nr:hypothetical protein [Deltaproteobacteria bacterium]
MSTSMSNWIKFIGLLAIIFVSLPVHAQSVSDDIGTDGLKHRGDGSIDDSQPGVAGNGFQRVSRDENRSRDDDGTRTR